MSKTVTRGNLTVVDNRGSTVASANPDTSATPDTSRATNAHGVGMGGKGGTEQKKNATDPLEGVGIEDVPIIGPGLDAAKTTGEVLGSLTKASTWLRIGEGILGVLALIGGVVLLAKATGFTKPAEQAVGAIVGVVGPGGKVGKAISVAQSVKGGASGS